MKRNCNTQFDRKMTSADLKDCFFIVRTNAWVKICYKNVGPM